jgi:serine protease Do
MTRKSVLMALGLITVGIIFGVVLVSNFSSGINLGFARGDQDVKLGGQVPIATQNSTIKALSENFAAVSKAVTPSVVGITVTTEAKKPKGNMPQDFWHFFGPDQDQPERAQGFGSGVIITADGYIVTNNHVVDGAGKNGIEVTLGDKSTLKATLVGTDPTTDVAIVKVDAKNLPAVALGNSDNLQVGEWVLAIGNPMGFLTSTVTQGIISAMGRNIDIIRSTQGRANYAIENFIQTDAAINPGNSGGALVNMNGEMIGINTAIASTNGHFQGYGFAIPVNIVKTVAADLIRYGEVRRGYIGVQIKAVDQTLADAIGLKDAKGVFVDAVVKGGAGDRAGLKEGDVIVSIDGRDMNAPNELQSYIATKHIGDEVALKVYRDGKTLEKKVTLKARDTKDLASADKEEKGKEEEKTSESARTAKFSELGLTVRSLTRDEKEELKVERGVLVTEVEPYSEAAKRGLRPNQVILDADKKPVASTSDLKKVFEGKKSGDSVLLRVRLDEETVSFVAVQLSK